MSNREIKREVKTFCTMSQKVCDRCGAEGEPVSYEFRDHLLPTGWSTLSKAGSHLLHLCVACTARALEPA